MNEKTLPVPGDEKCHPPADWGRSPITGYTREHWESAADRLLESAWRWASPSGAALNPPGPASASGPASDGLEGFARSMLIAAFRVAGSGGTDRRGWLARYARGLQAGTARPGDPLPAGTAAEPWPVIGDHFDGGQPMVEAASVALALRLTRPWLWDLLDPLVQERAVDWLSGALRAVPAPNNWYLFPYTVAGFLESVGRGSEETRAARRRALALLEGWYGGDGWYADGEGRAFDQYNGWAMHFYPVLDAWMDGRTDVHVDRLETFLARFRYQFGSDGAPVYMGRSMTYRWAAGTAIAVGALTGRTPISPGQSRRLLSGSLRYFLERGALNEHGLPSLGWHGEHAPTVQDYSGPASPLWAAKAFVCLLAPRDSALWTATEELAPVERESRMLADPVPNFLIQATADDGIVRLHNHGSDKVRPYQEAGAAGADPLYARLAYSSATGPTRAGEPEDNHVGVNWRGNRSARRRIHPIGAADHGCWGWAASWHRPVFATGSTSIPGMTVESYVVACGSTEVRIQRVRGALYDVVLECSGWAVPQGSALESTLENLQGFVSRETAVAPSGTAFGAGPAAVPRLTAPVRGDGTFVARARLAPHGTRGAGIEDVEVSADGARVRFRFVPSSAPPERSGDPLNAPLSIVVDMAQQTVQEARR
ncbi:DUF2264 domain-containing protein [Zhihengliuella alba]|uniref:DUF2264 domain-containing protein n=1 Tax=Zhihengliuella alba TaxID=547018 RepID=A0ABP7DI67_9MICC